MADGVELIADAWGAPDRPPAILLHGGGQTRHAWKRTAAVLAGHGYYALAVDLWGHGESGWAPQGAYSIDPFSPDCRALLVQSASQPFPIRPSPGRIPRRF